jgi:hypothetical protein
MMQPEPIVLELQHNGSHDHSTRQCGRRHRSGSRYRSRNGQEVCSGRDVVVADLPGEELGRTVDA